MEVEAVFWLFGFVIFSLLAVAALLHCGDNRKNKCPECKMENVLRVTQHSFGHTTICTQCNYKHYESDC